MLKREFCDLFAPLARGVTGQRLVPSGRRTGLLFALAVWIASVAPILAQTFPALTDGVVDEAGIIDPARRLSIIGKLADLEAKTTVQLVVVTLKSLQGVSIEDFALRLGNHWNIGQTGKNNGVLLVVAPKEGKVRIEVGRGLENKLSNETAKRIIDNSIIPSFRINDLPVGISQGVDDLLAVLL